MFFYTYVDFMVAVIICFAGLFILLALRSYFSVDKIRIIIIYFWHALFSFFFAWYSLLYGGDAIAYYEKGANYAFEFEFGTSVIDFFCGILINVFGLTLIGAFLVFSIFGAVGLLALDASMKIASKNKTKNIKLLAGIIVFLPSVSFWSSAIGKDSISFMAVGLALWAALNLKMRLGLMSFAVVSMLLVRPHMAGIMVIALAVAPLLESRATLFKKLFMGILSFSAAAVMVPFALTYAGMGDVVDAESVSSYIDTRQSHNMEGGGGIDIANMSLPEQLFAYMFRPLIFEVNSIFSAAAALDNLILLFLFVAGGWAMLKGKRSDFGENRVFMWVYALMAWGVLAMTTANLGIALRQKWMFAPILIFLFISVIGRRKQEPSVWQSVNHDVYASSFHTTDRHRQH